MRVLVCGSRTWTDRTQIRLRLARLAADKPTIVHGDARGADKIAAQIADDFGFAVEAHPADWQSHGKAAGPIRNREMLDGGVQLVIAFARGEARGTRDCIRAAQERGIPVEVHEWDGPLPARQKPLEPPLTLPF